MTRQTKWILGACLALLAIPAIMIVPTTGIRWYRVYDARQGLHHEHPGTREKAVRDLVRLGDRESCPEIRKLLNDKDSGARRTAVYALGQMGDTEAIPAIRQTLKDKDVRYTAAIALAELNDRESIPLVKELFQNKDEIVRAAAEWALKRLGLPKAEITAEKERDYDTENFKAIEDFYRKKFPNTSFQDIKIGAGLTDGVSAGKMSYHIFVPKEIEEIYIYPYEEVFLVKQSAGADTLKKMIADNLLQLRKGVLSTRPGATESYDGAPEIECIDYVTPYKYYLLDHPRKELIPLIKELLTDTDKKARDQAEQVLKTFGLTEKEIKEAKEEKK